MFGLLKGMVNAGIKVAITPLGVLDDARKAATGDIEEGSTTGRLLGGAVEDLADGIIDPFGFEE